MPRKKRERPDPKWVHPVAKMKRASQLGGKHAKPKPRVTVGTAAAKALGIKVQP